MPNTALTLTVIAQSVLWSALQQASAPMKAQAHDPKQGVCQRWNFSLWKNMLGFVALLKREEKTTDISFQVSTPLNNQQETDSYPNKGKSFHWGKQGSQAANPISQHSKNENAYTAASPVSDRAQLLPNNRATAVQLSAFTSSLRGKDPGMPKPANSLHWGTQHCKGRGVLRNLGDSFVLLINTQPCSWHS